MSITNERREEVSQMMRKAGFSEAEIHANHHEVPKTRKNGKRGEYKRTVREYINLHGKFPPKEVWTKFTQCPQKPGTQRGVNSEIRRDYTKDTGKEFKYESGVHRVENFEVDPEHERALMEAMKRATAEELGLEKAQIKQDRISPTWIQTFKNMDRTFDDYSYWKTLSESIIKTDGYLNRLNRFNRFKEEYLSD